MSKNFHGIPQDFRKKIDKILTVKGIKLWKLAQETGMASTLEKAYRENREMRPSLTSRFLKNCGIRIIWWETGEGEIFEEKLTPVTLPSEGKREELVIETLQENISLLKQIQDLREQLMNCRKELAFEKAKK